MEVVRKMPSAAHAHFTNEAILDSSKTIDLNLSTWLYHTNPGLATTGLGTPLQELQSDGTIFTYYLTICSRQSDHSEAWEDHLTVLEVQP